MPPEPSRNKDMFNRQRSGVSEVRLLAIKNNARVLRYLTHIFSYI
ncbi:hypothetical protein VCRA2121O391_300032 [Vibrio crassostreae]|nr:hypothetical protein VCRA2117O378_320032 [Vibrio crassostreae]CAK2867242.1 hypothetical protein VCRA2121O391_300032 [Vibrio crassostreae]CAK3913157.1 hypothetical protein VCRA2133O404_320029 [Vibrio crassostreae]